MIRYLAFSLIIVTLALASSVGSAKDAEQSRGAQILSQYKHDLQAALRSGLGKGVVEAIAVCRIEAPEIAESLSQEGIRVGRASHRLRNPDNASPDWVAPILEVYLANPSDREPRVVSRSADQLGYVEPLVLQPQCTVCHGEIIAPEVATRINQLYPEDRAVGFKAGDLRGVFWVEYPVAK